MRIRLAMLREGANITQTQISQRAGISQGYYSDIESGVRCPSPIVAMRIARALDIPDADIFCIFYAEEQRKRRKQYAG